MATVIRMPQLAAGATEGVVQTWLVERGETVSTGQSLVEIETEKAVVEYEAEIDGIFAGSLIAAGDGVAVGAPIAVLAAPGESLEAALAEAGHGAGTTERGSNAPAASPPSSNAAPDGDPARTEPLEASTPAGSAAATTATAPEGRIFVTPLVRRLAAERGIDVQAIPGSGPKGRITRRDFEAFVASRPASGPQELPVAPEEVPVVATTSATTARRPAEAAAGFTDVPHTGMRRAIGRRLSESKATVPHFYLVADAHVDELLALRARINEDSAVKVSVNDLVLKAVAQALKDVPDANAIWTDDATRRFDAVDLAVAVSIPNGLLTPVVRGADSLSLGALSSAVRELAARAREGAIKQHELEGGSFAVSNLGMYGTRQFAAIINPPHAGILAVGAALKRPIVTADGELGIGTVMTVTLSADHRVLDGALAAEWLAAFVARIENPLSILV